MDSRDLDTFEREWVQLAEDVVQQVFANPEIQQLKTEVRTNGRLTWEQKNLFFTIADRTKSDLIEQRHGPAGSDGYKQFAQRWQIWQRERGRKREKPANLFEENISHFLYGSTPDPELFLRNFDLYSDT